MTVSDPVKLSRPIERSGGASIEELTLRQPESGEMRGLKLFDLMQGDVDAIIKLLPRIASPTIIAEEAARLNPADLAAVASEVLNFFSEPGSAGEGSAAAPPDGLIDDAMADIAAIFHWPLAAMEAMSLPELLGWHTRALERWNRMNRVD